MGAPSMRGSGGSDPYGGSALCLRYVLLLCIGERSSVLLSLTASLLSTHLPYDTSASVRHLDMVRPQ